MAEWQIKDLTTNPSPALTDVMAEDNVSSVTYKSTKQKLFDLIASLAAVTTATPATDVVPVNISGTTSKMTLTNFINSLVGPGADGEVMTVAGGLWTSAAAAGGGDFANGGEAGGAARSLGNTDDYDLSLLTNNLARLLVHDNGEMTLPYQSVALANGGGGTQSIATSTWTKVTMAAKTVDVQSEFDATTNYNFTAKEAGVYVVAGMVMIVSPNDQVQMGVAISLNSSIVKQTRAYAPVGAKNHIFPIATVLSLSATNTVHLEAFQANGGNLNVDLGATVTALEIVKVA